MKVEIFKNFCILELFVICLAAPILLARQSTLDELWKHSFAQNIANGIVPNK
jgi:hypothetical protein